MTTETAAKFKQYQEDLSKGWTHVQRLATYKDRHAKSTAVELSFALSDAQDTAKWLDDLLSHANAEIEVIRTQLIPEAMEEEGLASPLAVAGLGRVSLTPDVYVSIGAAEPEEGVDYKAEFYAWLRSNNLESLITEGVNPSTLKAFVKDRLKMGKALPTNLLKITPYTRAAITRTPGSKK